MEFKALKRELTALRETIVFFPEVSYQVFRNKRLKILWIKKITVLKNDPWNNPSTFKGGSIFKATAFFCTKIPNEHFIKGNSCKALSGSCQLSLTQTFYVPTSLTERLHVDLFLKLLLSLKLRGGSHIQWSDGYKQHRSSIYKSICSSLQVEFQSKLIGYPPGLSGNFSPEFSLVTWLLTVFNFSIAPASFFQLCSDIILPLSTNRLKVISCNILIFCLYQILFKAPAV